MSYRTLTPKDVSPHSNLKVWWKCEKGHKWRTSVNARANGTSCPYCIGSKVHKGNCLATLNPELSKQWNYEKNCDLTPNDITYSSNKKVWWKCEREHEWEETVYNRKRGHSCPYCSGHRVSRENCLSTVCPELVKEWNYKKNTDIKPEDVKKSSNRKVWWICDKGHEWIAVISSRTNLNCDCPYCSGRKATVEKSLEVTNPEIAKEWDCKKNGDLTPKNVSYSSGRNVAWICSVNKTHRWNTAVCDRTGKWKTGCPYCANQKIDIGNCLATLNPELSKEWHPTKNGDLTPFMVSIGSNRKVWWICDKGHEYLATVHQKKRGIGVCPYCQKRFREENSLINKRPELSKEWHPTKNGDLTTNNVTYAANRKVWWICDKGHEWEAIIANRSKGTNCPHCRKTKGISNDNKI